MTDQPFRVFISYSHEDVPIFQAVRAALGRTGVHATADIDLRPGGVGFTEQIQMRISHSHLFVPILPRQSHVRGWVHQEIGFAVAMKVPCVPICVGRLPEGMIALRQAITVDDTLDGLDEQLARINFNELVAEAGRRWDPPADVAEEPEVRAEKIQVLADGAFTTAGPGCVRISGGLSSFSLPDERPDHPSWKARYGTQPRGVFSYEKFRSERRALQRHASAAGVKMIVNLGLDLDGDYGPGATRTRLCILLKFLESLAVPDDLVQIASVEDHPNHLTLAVGDWFVAESRAGRPVRGVLHTAFIVHAPTVSQKVAEFDEALASLLGEEGIPPAQSRRHALEAIRQRIQQLPRHPAWGCE